MWKKLQDPIKNIYYCGLVLRMEANNLGYKSIKNYEYSKIKKVFSAYNGASTYGEAVLLNYKEFEK